MLHRTLPVLLLSLPTALGAQEDPLAALAARLEASTSPHEKVELARLGRRLDRGGSVWWFEEEARVRLEAGEPCAAVRACTDALAVPLVPADRARLHRLRAAAFASLDDEPRELGDLAQVVRLDPTDRVASARLHGLLAARLAARRTRRDVVDRAQAVEAAPEEPRAHLAHARALDLAGREDEALAAWLEADRLDRALLDLADRVRVVALLLERGETFDAHTHLERAAEVAPDADLGALESRLDERIAQQARDLGAFAEPEAPDTTRLEPAELDRLLAEWNAVADELDPWPEERFAPYHEASQRWLDLSVQLEAARTPADLAALAPEVDEVRRALDAFFAGQLPLQARFDAAASGVLTWTAWADARTEAGLDVGPYADRIAEAFERVYSVGNPEVWRTDEQLAAAVEQHVERVRRAQLAREGTAALLSARAELTPTEVLSRAARLATLDRPAPELLALQGLAEHAAGSGGAVVALHASLATLEPHALENEVHAALDSLRTRGLGLVPAIERLLEEGTTDAARSLAARAADLAALEPSVHVLEARAHELRVPVDPGAEGDALEAVRLADALGPDDRVALTAHLHVALRARELSEARDAADRLLALDPRDPTSILERLPVLYLTGEADLAHRERRFAWRNGDDDEWLAAPRWTNQRLRDWGLKPGPSRAWDATGPWPLIQRMPWVPGGDEHGDATRELAVRLIACLDGAPLDTLEAPPADLDADEAWRWPAIALYYRAEVQRARGDSTAARETFLAALEHRNLPVELAYLAGVRTFKPLRRRAERSHLPLRVPQEVADLEAALKIARPGQEVVLGEGTHSLPNELRRSVRIRGVGAERTRLRETLWSSTKPTQLHPVPALRSGPRRTDGWIELADLTWTTAVEGDAPSVQQRVSKGALLAERCAFDADTSFELVGGTRAFVADCVVDARAEGEAHPFLVGEGAVTFDAVRLSRPVRLGGAARLEADGLTLRGAGSLELVGDACAGDVARAIVQGGARASFVVADGARLALGEVVYDGRPGVPLVDGAGVEVARLEAFGGVDSGGAHVGEQVERWIARDAATEEPLVVSTRDELHRAHRDGHRHLHLSPGTYDLFALEVTGQLVLRAPEGGVVLQVPTDQTRHVVQVARGAELVLDGVTLDLRRSRDPEPGDPLFGTGGVYGLGEKFPAYELLDVWGSVRLVGCTEAHNFAGERTSRQALAHVHEGGLLLAYDLEGGTKLELDGRALLVDGGVDELEVRDGGSVHLAGRGVLERLEVTGASARVRLDDLREGRVELAAFRAGATDPRSDLERRRDGQDPLVLRDEALARARQRWLEPLAAGASVGERARALAAYAEEHERALRLTEPDPRTRAQAVASGLGAHVLGDRDLQRAVLSELGYGATWEALVWRVLPADDRNAYFARNRAVHALGEGADEAELAFHATWEEAVLAGTATRAEMEEGRAWGMSPTAYRQELARRVRVAAEREAEAEAALASGDRDRIRTALQAISTDRWFEYVTRDDSATLEDVEDALAGSSGGTRWRYYLEHKRNRLEDDRRRQQGVGGWSGGGGGGSFATSYAAPLNDFQTWTKEFNTWSRNFDNWMSDFQSSSYSSYRNDYSY